METQAEREAKMRLARLQEQEAKTRTRTRSMEFLDEWNRTHVAPPTYEDAIAWADAHPVKD